MTQVHFCCTWLVYWTYLSGTRTWPF